MLIDHELAFPSYELGDSQLPWELGGMERLKNDNRHLFYMELHRQAQRLDFSHVKNSWLALSDDRLEESRSAIPPEWDEANSSVDRALDRIRQARDNIDCVIREAQRVLQ